MLYIKKFPSSVLIIVKLQVHIYKTICIRALPCEKTVYNKNADINHLTATFNIIIRLHVPNKHKKYLVK